MKERKKISEQEKLERLEAVRYAKASFRLEGIVIAQELLDLADKYVDGFFTDEEFMEESTKAMKGSDKGEKND